MLQSCRARHPFPPFTRSLFHVCRRLSLAAWCQPRSSPGVRLRKRVVCSAGGHLGRVVGRLCQGTLGDRHVVPGDPGRQPAHPPLPHRLRGAGPDHWQHGDAIVHWNPLRDLHVDPLGQLQIDPL